MNIRICCNGEIKQYTSNQIKMIVSVAQKDMVYRD
jgi:hypothetical protein